MSRRTATLFRVLVAALALLAAYAGLSVVVPTASAEEPLRLVDITLTRITPSLPTRDQTITLRGRVTNITDRPLDRPRLYFWRNQAPITSQEGVDQALESEANNPLGKRLLDETAQDLTTDKNPVLEPGKSAGFRITVPVAALELPPTDGVYLMGVHVLVPTSNFAIGRARLFVPVVDQTATTMAPLRMTSLVLFTSRPSLIMRNVFADEHLAKEVGSGGRLTALLEAAATAGSSFAVDPALVEELGAMADGYQVRNGDGSTVAGVGQSDAARWLDDFDDLLADGDGFRLPYASPDLAALTHDQQLDAVRASTAAGKLVEDTRELPLLAFPAAGAADLETVQTAASLDPEAILLADSSAAGNGPLLEGPPLDGAAGPPIISYSAAEARTGGGPGPDPRNTAAQVQQRFLAETWIQATTQSDESVHGRVRVISTAAQARGDDSTSEAPWLRATTLSDLLKTKPRAWDQRYRYATAARTAELTFGQLDRLRRLTAGYQSYAEMLVDGSAIRTRADSAIARAASAGWRKHDRSRQRFLDPQQAALDAAVLTNIRISSSARVQTVGRQVAFPITVVNNLEPDQDSPDASAVALTLVFTSDNSQRLSIKSIDLDPIRAQDSATEAVQVVAKANGTVPVVAQLTTRSGRKIGRPVTVDVDVTQNGTTGWAIAIGSGIVLAGTTTLRIRTVQRAKAKEASGGESALTSAAPVDDAGHTDDTSSGGVRDV